jgi:hypothetical protein
MVTPMRPVSEEVGRPVNAPNYPAMYSESIRAALAPAQYLLDMQKELSEEDVRKAQIQNWLSEADQKNQEIKETQRSHLAEEANQAIQRGLEGRRIDEETRHNQADESHSSAMEGLESRRLDIETRGQDLADARAEAEQEWRDRSQKATEDYQKGELEIRKGTQESDIARNNAEIERYKTETEAQKTENQQKQEDEQTIRDAQAYITSLKPEDVYGSADNPEISDRINKFYDQIHTPEATRRFEAIVGQHNAVGQEIADRKELNSFGPEAKRTFQENMLNSSGVRDPYGNPIPTQLRFNDALRAARSENAMEQERSKWAPQSLQAYHQTLAQTKDPNQAMAQGRLAQQQQETAAKQKEQKPDPKLLTYYQTLVPKRPGETDEDFAARSSQEAVRLNELYNSGDIEGFHKRLDDLKTQSQGQGGGSGLNWLQRTFGVKKPPPAPAPEPTPDKDQMQVPSPTTMVNPGQPRNPLTTMPSQSAPALAMNTSPVANEEVPEYRSSTDNDQLDQAFSTLFGSKAAQASATLPIV